MNENGAQDAVAYNLGAANHNGCALSAITNSMLWFYSLNATTTTSIPDIMSEAHSSVKVYDLKGRIIYTGDLKSRPQLQGIFLVQPDDAHQAQKTFLNW